MGRLVPGGSIYRLLRKLLNINFMWGKITYPVQKTKTRGENIISHIKLL